MGNLDSTNGSWVIFSIKRDICYSVICVTDVTFISCNLHVTRTKKTTIE